MVGATISTILNMAKVFLLYSDFFLLSMMTVKNEKNTSQKINAINKLGLVTSVNPQQH